MIFISIAAPQDLQIHQQEEKEKRKAGDIYRHCGTARPIKPSEGRERESFANLNGQVCIFNPCYTSDQVCFPYFCYINGQVCFHNHCHNKPFTSKYTLQVNIHSNNNNKQL